MGAWCLDPTILEKFSTFLWLHPLESDFLQMTYKPQRYFTMIRDHENKLTTDKKYFEKKRKFKL